MCILQQNSKLASEEIRFPSLRVIGDGVDDDFALVVRGAVLYYVYCIQLNISLHCK